MPRRKRIDMQKMTIAQQNELVQRRQTRNDIRAANIKLRNAVLQWLTGREMDIEEFMKLFHAGGHKGQYHQTPEATTFRRVSDLLAEIDNLVARLNDTPLDYMGAIELSYVYERIMRMLDVLEAIPGGNESEAIDLYYRVGDEIRGKVFTDMGYYPEEFPTPSGRMTGKESERQFQLTDDYQPPLF